MRRTRCADERCAVERERCAGGVAHCVPSNAAPSNVWNAAPSPGCGQPTRQGGGSGLSLSGGGNAAQWWGQWMKFLMVEATPLWAVWWSGDAALGSIATSTCTVAFDWLWVAVCPVATRGCVSSAVGLHRTRVALEHESHTAYRRTQCRRTCGSLRHPQERCGIPTGV